MATVLVTGCNRGIGLELARQFQARGDTVIGVCRRTSPELADLDIEVMDSIDVSVASDISDLQEQIGQREISILVNNAGMLQSDTVDSIDFDAMVRQFEVNSLGPLRVTLALLGNLPANSRVAIVSSRVGSIADNSSGRNYGYRTSKAAVNMIGANLHHDLAERQIAVALLHPGLVATDMTGGTGVSPTDSAAGLIARIDGLNLENSGSFWHAEGYELPW